MFSNTVAMCSFEDIVKYQIIEKQIERSEDTYNSVKWQLSFMCQPYWMFRSGGAFRWSSEIATFHFQIGGEKKATERTESKMKLAKSVICHQLRLSDFNSNFRKCSSWPSWAET